MIYLILITVLLAFTLYFFISVRLKMKEGSKNNAYLELIYSELISNSMPFYSKLSNKVKKRFWRRLDAFINDHEFEGREQFELSEAVIVQISATAIHLTLGLNDFLLDHFKKILVYPDIYYSPFTKTHNKGETNPHGIITLSWPHAKEGIDNSSDSINLCYHEFAHALMLQYVNTGVNDLMFQIGYEYFSYLLQHHQLSQYTQSTGILRDYAFANKMEFWAVSVESFLENPSQMQIKCFPLYDLLCKMLRQDPQENKYGFLSSFPLMDDV